MAVDPRLIEALRHLDPAAPATEGEYVPRDLAGGRAWNVLERVQALLLSGNRLRGLIHGCTGVGKSTEFARWRARISGEVTFLEVRVTASGESGWRDAFAATAQLHLERGRLRQEAIALGHARKSALHGEEAALETRMEAAFTELRKRSEAPLLCLVDGADLWSGADASRAFGPGGYALRPGFPPFVATVPHAWALAAGPGQRDERVDAVWYLPPFPVVAEDGKPQEAVIASLAAGLASRLGDLTVLESPALLQRVALSSGGVPRHAVVLLRQAILAATGVSQVRVEHVLDAERELRQDLRHSVPPTGGGDPSAIYVSGLRLLYEGPERRYERPHPLVAT